MASCGLVPSIPFLLVGILISAALEITRRTLFGFLARHGFGGPLALFGASSWAATPPTRKHSRAALALVHSDEAGAESTVGFSGGWPGYSWFFWSSRPRRTRTGRRPRRRSRPGRGGA